MPTRGKLKVLLIEDDDGDRALVEQALRGSSDQEFKLRHVTLIGEGVELLRSERFDVTLLDLNLPDSAGLETVKAAKNGSYQVPIICLTGTSRDSAIGLQAIQHGAQDFLSKDAVTQETLTRSILFAIERKQSEAASQEMKVAAQMLRQLYPPGTLSIPGFSIAGMCFPAGSAAGDYFDFIPLRDGSQALILADVSGHGLGPAMVMTQTRAHLHAMARFTSDVSEMVAHLDEMLGQDTLADRFVTMFFLQLYTEQMSFRYIGAGHNAFWLKSNGELRTLDSTSTVLGLNEHRRFNAASPQSLEPGELIFAMTDGITEMRTSSKELYGTKRAIELVKAHASFTAKDIVNALYQDAREFANDEPQHDDVAIIVVKSLG
jgi:CheY-like chemotaxis protein